MIRTRLWPLAAACLLPLLLTGPAHAEPEADAQGKAETEADTESGVEQTVVTDEDFAKTLIGATYSGRFELEGWTDQGGGLVLPPIYVHHYNREDGTILVVTAKETGSAADFEITDTLLANKPHKGYTFSTSCMKGDDYTLRFMGEAGGKDASEWWTNLRKAWEIDIETGKISDAGVKGVKCVNPNW
ncbi:hypothetical protein [Methyloceanibacter sp.]|uniref:hypothetical protein n=1 Tax=Methyloceanibacter sp. TaxID=1965321 RepID=UPI002CB2966B|nr:hypothetical protein [Methyloceanibacter sp.]HML93153.1 hypothetical protein [Methyloceanibacter sp.]